MDAKVAKLRKGGKPRGRYSPEAKAVCWNYWIAAENREELWRSVNTRVTFETVFEYFRIQLARIGVTSSEEYAKIIRAERRRRNRELSARQDVARQKTAQRSAGTVVKTVGKTVDKKPDGTTNDRILDLLATNPRATQEELARVLGLSVRGVEYAIGGLKRERRLRKVGGKKLGHWEVLR